MAKQKVVYLAYSRNPTWGDVMMRVYGTYDAGYSWLTEIAQRHRVEVTDNPGGRVAAQVYNQEHDQFWWIERHDVV